MNFVVQQDVRSGGAEPVKRRQSITGEEAVLHIQAFLDRISFIFFFVFLITIFFENHLGPLQYLQDQSGIPKTYLAFGIVKILILNRVLFLLLIFIFFFCL